MASLTKKEIEGQLKKFGVNSTSEQRTYLKEYRQYPNIHNIIRISPQIPDEIKTSYGQAIIRLARAWFSVFPVIANILTFSRVKAYKRLSR